MKKLLLFFVPFICTVNQVSAQNIDSIVNKAAANFLASGKSVGFSIGIIKDDVTYKYHFGYAKKDGKVAVTDETIYEIGSVTKTFTSALLAQAVIEKRVKLSDDIRKFLKGSYPNLAYNGKPIQLLHLANLTSSLPNNLPEKMPAIQGTDQVAQLRAIRAFHETYTKEQFLADLHTVTLKEEPGLHPAHSNTAAELLGFLLENIYGKSYDALVKQYITAPLEMPNTFVFVPAAKQNLCAMGYNDNGVSMPDIPKDAGSAGVLRSSLPDMLNYLKAQILEKNAQVIMSHTPTWGDIDNEAIGLNWWVKKNFDDQIKVSATGGTFGQACYISAYPGRNYGIVILSNENDNAAEDRLGGMAQSIYNELYFTAAQRASDAFGFSHSVNVLLDVLNKNGFETAIQSANELKQKDSSFKLVEDELNSWGYKFFFKGEKHKALEIFKLNVNLYPQSANTYDSLAETYEDMGDKVAAIANYKKDLELNPKNIDVAEHLKKLEQQ